MMFEETENIELKERLIDDIEKEVVAFLNSHSGIIYIGVDDDGKVIGVENCDNVLTKITDKLKK